MSGNLLHKLLLSRTGCGIAIRGNDLVVVIVRVTEGSVEVLDRAELRSFRSRSPGEWGAEYSRLLESVRQRHLKATLAVPRSEVVLRMLSLPPMGRSDLAKAIEIQLDDLHPYGDAPIYYSFTPIRGVSGSASQYVAIAIAEARRIDGYVERLAEAGIDLAGCTLSADALQAAAAHTADSAFAPFLLADRQGSTLELYGSSEDTPLLSSCMHLDGVALEGTLRLAQEGLGVRSGRDVSLAYVGTGETDSALSGIEVVPAERLVATPSRQVEGFDLKRDTIAMGTAVLSADRERGLGLNLLPPSARRRMSVAPLIPRLTLGGALAVLALLLAILPTIQDWRYAQRLREETARLEASATTLAGDVRDIATLEGRYGWLLERQERIRSDIDLIREISETLPGSAWLTALRLEDDKAVLAGMATEADPLLSLLSSSATVGQARFVRSPARSDGAEQFQIEAQRR